MTPPSRPAGPPPDTAWVGRVMTMTMTWIIGVLINLVWLVTPLFAAVVVVVIVTTLVLLLRRPRYVAFLSGAVVLVTAGVAIWIYSAIQGRIY